MTETTSTACPVHNNVDRRKSARIALENTQAQPGTHWIKKPSLARKILRHSDAFQAGAGADLVKYKNPEQAPVFFLDGKDHAKKRQKTQRFLSPKAVADQHYQIMREISDQLLAGFQTKGQAHLEDLSFSLAIEVVGEILGLTNSKQQARARRIQRVLHSSIAKATSGPQVAWLNLKRVIHTGWFFLWDVRPAIKARRKQPKDDAISFFIEEGYSNLAVIVECLTYGTAGMLTTREFIIMAAWYLFEDETLRERFMNGEVKDQLAVLMEILRLEPVAAMIMRRVDAEVDEVEGKVQPAGEVYSIDIRAANVDDEMVGECPFALDPDRAKRQKENGRYMSFSDGPHNCPGWLVALHETRIFLQQMFQVPGIKLDREPDISWNAQLGSYELRNALISCDVKQ